MTTIQRKFSHRMVCQSITEVLELEQTVKQYIEKTFTGRCEKNAYVIKVDQIMHTAYPDVVLDLDLTKVLVDITFTATMFNLTTESILLGATIVDVLPNKIGASATFEGVLLDSNKFKVNVYIEGITTPITTEIYPNSKVNIKVKSIEYGVHNDFISCTGEILTKLMHGPIGHVNFDKVSANVMKTFISYLSKINQVDDVKKNIMIDRVSGIFFDYKVLNFLATKKYIITYDGKKILINSGETKPEQLNKVVVYMDPRSINPINLYEVDMSKLILIQDYHSEFMLNNDNSDYMIESFNRYMLMMNKLIYSDSS